MGRRNLELMRAIDTAWNMRQWADYADLLDEDLVAWMSGEDTPHGKAEHIVRAQRFCARFPDCRVHMDPYLDLFLSLDTNRTCSIALLSGSSAVTKGTFKVSFTAICRWNNGRIIEQREYFDNELLMKQLGLHPTMTSNGEL
ncbi:ester cyclase [Rhizobium puerariae]|uniref:Ester cyclase n=1 Tax=Rhizobium puerariae TaxID=1585791 RepID=A0ABV6AQK2_9HYPH